jgi:hypothetical protein
MFPAIATMMAALLSLSSCVLLGVYSSKAIRRRGFYYWLEGLGGGCWVAGCCCAPGWWQQRARAGEASPRKARSRGNLPVNNMLHDLLSPAPRPWLPLAPKNRNAHLLF